MGRQPVLLGLDSKNYDISRIPLHLYVLIPVFDNKKHYFVGRDQFEKLLDKSRGWLVEHPLKEEIARRYLKFQPSLYREALARLIEEESAEDDGELLPTPQAEEILETPISLNDQRLGAVLAALRGWEPSVYSIWAAAKAGCSRELLKDQQFQEIVGMDVSIRSLGLAKDRSVWIVCLR